MVKAAIYASVSTLDQHPENQLQELRQYVQARDWQAMEYVDHGVSGTRESRPALDRLVADAKRRRFDVLLVWRLDVSDRRPITPSSLTLCQRRPSTRSGLRILFGTNDDVCCDPVRQASSLSRIHCTWAPSASFRAPSERADRGGLVAMRSWVRCNQDPSGAVGSGEPAQYSTLP